MYFIDEEVRTIVIDLYYAGHYTFVLGLEEPYARYLIQEELNILPPGIVHLLAKEKSEASHLLLVCQLQYTQ